jgi:radical SAM superfamily enzyme YgiQ (UPF0313 family)
MLLICPLADIYSGVGNFGAPPLGPWRLTFYLRANGQHVDVWDCNTSNNLSLPTLGEASDDADRASKLAESFVVAMEKDFDLASYEWIGFSALNDTLPTTLGVIELIHKKYPSAKLVGGNHEATVNLQDALGRSRLNAIVMADAEESMLQLMQGKPPHEVAGVIWRNFQPKPPREVFEKWNAGILWGQIPYEDYWKRTANLYDLDKMPEEEKLDKLYEIHTVRIHTLVACELACTFCSVKTTRRWASGDSKSSIINLSPSALRKNLLAIKDQVPNVMTIYDSSDEAWLGKGRGEEYCAVLQDVKPYMDKGLPRGMRYLIQCRTNDLSEELIDMAAKAGVRHLTIGVESPVPQVRKDMRKTQNEELVRNTIRWGAPRGIDMYMLFIMFYPTITLEQLYEAIINWRIYMDLGATVSVEPFCMSYLGTDLHDDPRFITEYVGYEIPFSGKPAKKLKWATLIWPLDRRVCAILQWFRANIDSYIEEARKKAGHRHTFKGFTGKVTVDCLEAALKLYEQNKIPPWEPGEGYRTGVYQDYGDQMSGSEIAEAAVKMDRKNTTGSRFNSTHSLLDTLDSTGAIQGRIKDPALPHETLSKDDSQE